MSKAGISGVERVLARPIALPDFHVLLATLSAIQGASRTANIQTLIAQDSAIGMQRPNHLVSLFADGTGWEPFAAPGSFSADAAAVLGGGQ